MIEILYRMFLKLFWHSTPQKYARYIGVHLDGEVSIVAQPNWGSEPYLITIGNHTRISFGVTFLTHDGATWVFRDTPEYKDKHIMKYGKIVVGNNCFIGCKSIIMPNVTIGNNSIIGAGSLVTKSVPDNEVWAGVPARRICSLEDYIQKCADTNNQYDMKLFAENRRKALEKFFYEED